MRIRSYSTLNRIAEDHAPSLPVLPSLQNVWLHGDPGSGKSYEARRRFPGAFPKPLNKWWDGYKGEPYVIIDDWEASETYSGSGVRAQPLAHLLKVWADEGEFLGERKGASRRIRPRIICVTSNYTIDECFGYNVRLRQAIARRFTEVHWDASMRVVVAAPAVSAVPLPTSRGQDDQAMPIEEN